MFITAIQKARNRNRSISTKNGNVFTFKGKSKKYGRFLRDNHAASHSTHVAGAVQLCGRIHGLQSQISRSPKDGISGFEILRFCVGIYHVGNIWTDFWNYWLIRFLYFFVAFGGCQKWKAE